MGYLKREASQLDNLLLPSNMVGNFDLDLHRLSLKINASSFATNQGNHKDHEEHKEFYETATTSCVIFVPFVVKNYPMYRK